MNGVSPDAARRPLVLALDLGSSSVRALLFDALGRPVEGVCAREPYSLRATAEGASEVDADALLERAWRCVDRVLARAGDLAEGVAAVASCTFVTNVVGVDGRGRAVTPLSTYADTRATGEVAWLEARYDEELVRDRTGCPLHVSYLPARFLWYARHRPKALARAESWISIGEYLELRLFGEAAASYSVASWTGLLDRRRLVWYEPLLEGLPVGAGDLSRLRELDAPRRGLRADFAERWPALRDVPWYPALGDGAAANVGSGCTSPERVALTIGTTGALRVVIPGDAPPVPRGLWCYRVDAERYLLGGALSEGGNVYAWMRKALRLGDPAAVEAALAEMEPDEHGLTMLPFLSGERSPGWAGDARATFHGISVATTPLEMLRAGLESVAYRVGLVLDLLRPQLPRDFEVVVSGAALTASPTWLRIVADVLGRPLVVSPVEEASARGAALLALKALGVDVEAEAVASPPRVVPDAARGAVYRAAMERQGALYRRLIANHEA